MKTEASFAGGSHATDRVVAILGFHKIGEPPPGGWETWFYVPEGTFAGYLGDLREGGWHVIDLATFLHGLAEPDSLPERTALLTFDDGYRSIRHVALPWLRRFGFPAVLFVPTDFVGGRNDFDADCEPEEAICDWDDLRELERWQETELLRSRSVLEVGLGKPVAVFSFPYGDGGADPQATGRMLSRAGYRAACLYGGGPNPLPVADPYRLTRLAMGPDTDLRATFAHEPVAAR